VVHFFNGKVFFSSLRKDYQILKKKKLTQTIQKKKKQMTDLSKIKLTKRKVCRGPRSAWIIFVMQSKQNNPEPLPQLTKKIGPIWRGMSPEEKRPYEILYEQDLERYKHDLENISPMDKQFLRSERRKKRQLNSKKEKKPLSAFMFFTQLKRPEVVIDNPGATVPQIASLMGEKWRLLSEDGKNVYKVMELNAKKQYLEKQNNGR
jgi:hypothetical protein